MKVNKANTCLSWGSANLLWNPRSRARPTSRWGKSLMFYLKETIFTKRGTKKKKRKRGWENLRKLTTKAWTSIRSWLSTQWWQRLRATGRPRGGDAGNSKKDRVQRRIKQQRWEPALLWFFVFFLLLRRRHDQRSCPRRCVGRGHL